MGQNPAIPKAGARVLLWDIDHDHRAVHIGERGAYVRALLGALRSGKGFRLAWDGACSVEAFEWWCGVVWAALDGNYSTYIMVEELADVSPSSGKATPVFGELNRKCRKYGGELHWTTQRSQEVSKTAYDQAVVKYIGFPNDGARADHLARIAGVPEADLFKLNPLEFYRRAGGTTEKIALRYKKIA